MTYYKFVLLFLNVCYHSSVQDCKLRYATDFAKNESVLLWYSNNSYDLVKPENDGIILKPNQEIWLACPGDKNTFEKFDTNLIKASCVVNHNLKVDNKQYSLKDLGCSVDVTGEFFSGIDACSNGMGIRERIGYNIYNELEELIFVCYDNELAITFYSRHVLYGSALNYANNSNNQPKFKTDGIPSSVISVNNDYEAENEKQAFEKILGDKKLADKYFSRRSFLARGLLAPDADMIYKSSKSSTYFYINIIPQWQQINQGNWLSLETSIRKVASQLKENFHVYTGTYDVLTLEDINKNQTEVYLSNRKLPVPKFIWKVIHSLSTNKGIAFVSVNNPFIEKVTPDLNLCNTTKTCSDYSWGTSNWKTLSEGLIYCCKIDDLRQKVSHIPIMSVSGVQTGA